MAVPYTFGSQSGTIPLRELDDNFSYLQNGNIDVTSTGSTTARSLAIRFTDPVDVQDYGAVCDGVTDDSSAINSAITAANALGNGTPVRLGHLHAIASTIVITKGNTFIIGYGSGINHNTGSMTSQSGTVMKWTGILGGTMMSYSSPSSGQLQGGGGLIGVYFDSNAGKAATGLRVNNWRSGYWDDLFFLEFTTAGLSLETTDNLAEDASVGMNYFGTIKGRQIEQTGTFLIFSGQTLSNTNFNWFNQLDSVHKNGDAIVLNNSDNNTFNIIRTFRSSGGSGRGLVFNGANTGASDVARANRIYNISCNSSIVAKGTSSFTYPSYNNYIDFFDIDNGTVEPTIEAGASLWYNWIPKSWTPTVSAVSGSITTYSIQNAKFIRCVNRTIWFTVTINISDNGTGATAINMTLPSAAIYEFVVVGKESAGSDAVTGQCFVGTDPTILRISRYDGAYPNTSPTFITISGTYEQA